MGRLIGSISSLVKVLGAHGRIAAPIMSKLSYILRRNSDDLIYYNDLEINTALSRNKKEATKTYKNKSIEFELLVKYN